MSIKAIEIKKEQVTAVATRINDSAATVVVEYAGINVEDMKALRNELFAANVELEVIKNNISSRAFTEANLSEVSSEIVGATAIAFSKEDVTAAARILHNFSKTNPAIKLKAGSLEGAFASTEQVMELATLPNKEGMISMLLSVLEAPIRGLAQVTAQIAEQKED